MQGILVAPTWWRNRLRLIKNPVAQFLAAGFLALIVVSLATNQLSQRAANEEAVTDALTVTELLASSVAEPVIPRGLAKGDAGAIDQFDRTVLKRLLVDDVKRIKIWDRTGRIVYSDKTALIGERFDLDADEREVLAEGGSDAEVSDLSRPENRYETGWSGGLLEVYTRVITPEGDRLLFEAYYSANDIADRKEEIFDAFRPITLAGLLVLLALTTPLLWVLTRRLQASARDRERLLRAAVEASDSERRRIARDLHDGVVQDLAGTSFALTAAAHNLRSDPAESERLGAMSGSLRGSLRSLRSLLVEIYPPDLHTNGLAAALDDLVAPAAGAGVHAKVTVPDMDEVDDDVIALVWRVAQEAVRNALRHGSPDTLEVTVSTTGGAVVLVVRDDGRGFDPDHVSGNGHFGLRGLQDLIREAGGNMGVRSSPGAGTTVRLEVGG